MDLHDENGILITEDSGVEKVAVDYFEDLFNTTTPTDFDNFLEEIPLTITQQMNQRLLRLAVEE